MLVNSNFLIHILSLNSSGTKSRNNSFEIAIIKRTQIINTAKPIYELHNY